MRNKAEITVSLIIGGLLIVLGMVWLSPRVTASQQDEKKPAAEPAQKARVPAHYEDLKEVKEIPKTLSPDQFDDPDTKAAYTVARENPKLLLQMPCYCYCDAIGHKSLLSCYEDEHAAHCSLCRNEAIEADRLQKEEKLPADKIREKIIAKYARSEG
ncbi:MAG TPA: CYCXC family (seleno)protein [Blastocatellia bacterium]|nr:CYCXC family (seleno)protein [Blastocatellia bacterium]